MGSFFHIYCPEGVQSKYRLIVFDDEKKPFIPLIEYYHDQIKRISESSVIAYLNTLEPFFLWLKYKSHYKGTLVSWDHKPEAIKEAVRQYLIQEMHCKIRGREHHEGIYLTKKSTKTVQLFLSAIKGFYKTMIRLGTYADTNPLIDIEFDTNLPERAGERPNRPRLHQAAGTEEPISYRKQTDSYFKIINEEWVPEIIGDWDLPYRIYQAGSNQNWRLRDEVITRFMFETGARISEILELTIGDYRSRSDLHEFAASNKGSFKRRIKFIRISPETLKLLIKYVNSERRESANSREKFNELSEHESLFLSTRGTIYTYSAFYANWSRITNNAGIKLNPHKARHWFVTSMLRGIYESSETQGQIEDKKKQLIEYMKWRDPETLNVYEHYYDEQKFKELHEKLQKNYADREKEYFKSLKKKKQSAFNPQEPSMEVEISVGKPDWLNDFYRGMDE
ncbi:site-specific integrase [Paenibacillus thiaminolyticus]|uniref:Site-specific integrase n=1 Tax=Paenibacillus thiaminolyticus TaxID=49283 RepID=A0AAP9DRR4_PANTH|nr:tyrosine-type recombinase/integrase [Paenibacillus thiaminolyticus]MCY9539056.1 site-specific integrase [Paenibacillus thiaminolyticus]MCY9604500.1 site-specific integrase [Paenibacillus thiaminolyticus]MCY9610941.1 site-specific integrase [Paenibacillus thiaminolyticus]MCY9616820.1 site-specific integrase [Paenibacillus thiaminolyticus]MCY9622446.1 site-specific integrase [Paenibacillus thiaminolyticus]